MATMDIVVVVMLLSACVQVAYGTAAFESLLRSIQAAESTMDWIKPTLETEMAFVKAFPPISTTSAFMTIAELYEFDDLLADHMNLLISIITDTDIDMAAINTASSSVSPYQSNTDLAAFVLEAQTKTAGFLNDVILMADKVYTRYIELRFDITLNIDYINDALLVGPTLTEARDEIKEMKVDAHKELGEVLVNVKKAIDDMALRLKNVRIQLNLMSSPNPAFSTYLQAFADM